MTTDKIIHELKEAISNSARVRLLTLYNIIETMTTNELINKANVKRIKELEQWIHEHAHCEDQDLTQGGYTDCGECLYCKLTSP